MRDLGDMEDVRDKVGEAVRDSNTERVERLGSSKLGGRGCCCWG